MIDKNKKIAKDKAKEKERRRIHVDVDPDNYDYICYLLDQGEQGSPS